MLLKSHEVRYAAKNLPELGMGKLILSWEEGGSWHFMKREDTKQMIRDHVSTEYSFTHVLHSRKSDYLIDPAAVVTDPPGDTTFYTYNLHKTPEP